MDQLTIAMWFLGAMTALNLISSLVNIWRDTFIIKRNYDVFQLELEKKDKTFTRYEEIIDDRDNQIKDLKFDIDSWAAVAVGAKMVNEYKLDNTIVHRTIVDQ